MTDKAKAVTLKAEQEKEIVKKLSEYMRSIVVPHLDKQDRTQNLILNKIETLQHTIDTFNKELSSDRRDLSDLRIIVAALDQRTKEIHHIVSGTSEEVIEGVKTNINKQEDRMVEKIEEKVPNLVTQATKESVTETIETSKKTHDIHVNHKKRGFFGRLFRRKGNS